MKSTDPILAMLDEAVGYVRWLVRLLINRHRP